MISKMLLVCISQVMDYSVTLGTSTEHGTVAYAVPPHCNGALIEEAKVALPPPVLRYEYPPEAQSRALAAVPEQRVKTPAKKRKACKPGRWRDSRGVCRRKR